MYLSPQYYIEIPATLTAFTNIYLAARANIWNWLFGLFAVTLYAIIFYRTRLYGDMSLQAIYFYFQIYGWYQWRYGSEKHATLAVTRMPKKLYLTASVAMIALFGAFIFILSHYTNSTTPVIDAFTTSLSLISQWMMCRKWLENWALWILLDIVSIEMYWHKHLFLTAGLYGVFLILCCSGYRTWKNALQNSDTHAPA